MQKEARNRKLVERINTLLEKYKISEDITYSLQTKKGIQQCVITYLKDNKWDNFWCTTGIKDERGNVRKAQKEAEEIVCIFKETVKQYQKEIDNSKGKQVENEEQKELIKKLQETIKLNTTNIDLKKETKADWYFSDYLKYWLEKVIKKSVEPNTYSGYKRQVNRMIDYFSKKENKKKVKAISADDLEELYDYLRDEYNLGNATIDKYNDNVSGAFSYLLRKKVVRYNPTDFVQDIVIEEKEIAIYNPKETKKLLELLEKDIIELPTFFASFYGMRRSEIIGLREEIFDFENNIFTVNHIAMQLDGKEFEEHVVFKDKTKSKKGYRTFPLFDVVKKAVLKKLKRIEENKLFFGKNYNHKYDGYICVKDSGDIIQPSFFTKRFVKIVKKARLRPITPHGLRHSIATSLHLAGVDVRDLQDWLGHENISSTNRYTRTDLKKQVCTGVVVSKILEIKSEEQLEQKKNIYVTA